MKLDFDVNNIRSNNITLLDCQVDLILRSLEFYAYTYQYIYPRSRKSESEEENLRKSLIRDTYHQILDEFNISKTKNPIDDELSYDELMNNLQKIA